MRSGVLARLPKQSTWSLRSVVLGVVLTSAVVGNLESRELLASGNCTATVTNGSLYICGDNCANDICVRQICDGKWEIKGNCGTTINCQPCWTACEVHCSIKCDMKCGCDRVKVSDGCLKGCVTICCAQSSDCSVCVTCCTLGGLKVTTGCGMDDVACTHCKFVWDSSCTGKSDCYGCCYGRCDIDTGKNDDCCLVYDCCSPCACCKVSGGDGCNTNIISKCEWKSIDCCNGCGQGKSAVHCCKTPCCTIYCADTRTLVSYDGCTCSSYSCNTKSKCTYSSVVCDLFGSCDWSWCGCDSTSVW